MDFFGRTRHPYYIHAPDYRPTSAGIIAVYVLCHTINELGYEAYISLSTTTCDTLRAPLLTSNVMASHYKEGLIPISLSPETLNADPFDLPIKARWLLNQPGHLGGPEEISAEEILFHFDDWVLTEQLRERSLKLRVPTFDSRVFTNHNNPDDRRRSGMAYYAHKFLAFGGVLPSAARGWSSLGQEIPRSKAEIADILRRSEALICFEQSSIIAEALACGCPVILVPSSYWSKHAIGGLANHPGIALFDQADALAVAQATINAYPAMQAQDHEYCLSTIKQFIGLTQIAALKHQTDICERMPPPSSPASEHADLLAKRLWQLPKKERQEQLATLERVYSSLMPRAAMPQTFQSEPQDMLQSYQTWLNYRQLQASDGTAMANHMAERWRCMPRFHIFIRLSAGQETLLADTLDSLNYQLYNKWKVDVIGTSPPPETWETMPCLAWHHLEEPSQIKASIDFLYMAEQCELVIELPAGAILDPLCLWRIGDEMNRQPDCEAFFVDDDCVDNLGLRTRPRLKPGNNRQWLSSQDLAGPLFIRRRSLRELGGASSFNGSPWFDYLLRFQRHRPPQAVAHVSDVLISYRGQFPSSSEDCLHALLMPDAETAGAEILPLTESSWRIQPPPPGETPLSIAVISRGQLEFLQQCLDSLARNTTWPDIELLLVRAESDDHEFEPWIENYRFAGQTLRLVTLKPEATWAEACNAAIISAQHELVLLIQEDVRILEPGWLDKLVSAKMYSPDVSAVSPRMVRPGEGKIGYAGDVFGLMAEHCSPYQDTAHFAAGGYLDNLQVSRDVTLLGEGCMLLTRNDYIAVGGMESDIFSQELAHQDLSLKLLSAGKRLLYQPAVTIVHYGEKLRKCDHETRQSQHKPAEDSFAQRWLSPGVADPFWNPNFSLASVTPLLETEFHPAWQYLPVALPRIMARTVSNAQGDYRVKSPLLAARRAGLALDCIWPQNTDRELTPYELARLAPDVLIVQNYLLDPRLAGLEAWRAAGLDTFVIYALDDLFTEMPLKSSLRQGVPANARTRFRAALKHCDRMVVSTEFLADAYRPLFPDIRVVPNRLERERWLNLTTRKRTDKKPRIGWAGGTAHKGDLELIKPVIEATRDEADWVFMGMYTDEIRPLLNEFHLGVSFEAYPAALAGLNLDIAVAPLEMHRFNQGKSNLRLLEYGALGLPVVCTDIDPYRGSPACCLTNDPQRWIAALRERIHDAEAREAEGERMRQWVIQHYILEDHLDEWLAAHLP